MTNQSSRSWNIGLWIAQGLLAAMFIMAGGSKLFQPVEELSKTLPWVTTSNAGLARFVGLSELMGAIGLLLPSILRIRPVLTVWAAAGLALVQLLAIFFHISRGETGVIAFNIVILLMAFFIAWGRMKKAKI